MANFFDSSLIRQLSLAGLVGLGLTLAAHSSPSPTALPTATSPIAQFPVAQARQDIIDTAAAEGSFQTLLQLLDNLGMTEDLRGYGRFTVFAPTDAAFAAIPPDMMEKLSSDRDLMSKVLAYHVVSSESPLLSERINPPISVRTLERSEVTITKRRGQLYVNTARVIHANIEASNGVIHAIDQVLIPDDLMSQLSR
jgi:uncharacterized surface protein with fasciclin (FAS1) repeats